MDYTKLKVIYYDSDIINLDNIIWGLLQLGVDVVRSKIRACLKEVDFEQVELIKNEVKEYDYAISQNFIRTLAEGCKEAGVKYISWIYDSPQVQLYTDQGLYDTNYVFAFDKCQQKRLNELGLTHVFYQPLAANIAYISTVKMSKGESIQYASDISFIGQLYRLSYYFNFVPKLNQNTKEELQRVIDEYALNWGKGISIFNKINEDCVSDIFSIMTKGDFDIFHIDKRFIEETMLLAPGIAQRERMTLLEEATHIGKTSLYTKDSDVEAVRSINGLNVNGYVSGDIPYKIYLSSKINLNISYRTIETGAPQRIFDIMGSSGFVLSNYQEELEELFVPDKEIVLYSSIDEFRDKVSFYLQKERLREKIAIAGYNRVKREYNYCDSLARIFTITSTN